MKEKKTEGKPHWGESILQDLYIEVFASLIPGFIFVTGFGVLFVLCIQITWGIDFIYPFEIILIESKWIIFTGIMIFSYAVGAILYRKGPQKPDRIAAFFQWNKASDQEKSSLAVQFPIEKKTNMHLLRMFPDFIASRKNKNSEYPYRHTREYLIKRGLWHLAIFIPWCVDENQEKANDKDNKNSKHEDNVLFRSKHYINILKDRIKYNGSRLFILDIVRNEGHIRFLASLWHAFKLLHAFTFLAALAVICDISFTDSPDYYALIVLTAFFILTEIGKRNIQKSIHYVRSREVIMVLEKAYLLAKEGLLDASDFYQRNLEIFSEPRNCAACKKCRLSINKIQSLGTKGSPESEAELPCMFAVKSEWEKHLNPALHKHNEAQQEGCLEHKL